MSVVDPGIKATKKKAAQGKTKILKKEDAAFARVNRKGMVFNRRFTTPGVHPFDQIEYEYRTSKITEPDGTVIFQMDAVEVPKFWSQLATNVICSKYFYGEPGTPEPGREPRTPDPGREPRTPDPGREPRTPDPGREPRTPEPIPSDCFPVGSTISPTRPEGWTRSAS